VVREPEDAARQRVREDLHLDVVLGPAEALGHGVRLRGERLLEGRVAACEGEPAAQAREPRRHRRGLRRPRAARRGRRGDLAIGA
jgi:hypothetical protein